MITRNPKSNDYLVITIVIVTVLSAVVLLPSVTRAAPPNLPPRPLTPTPVPMPPRPPTSTPAPMPPRPPTPSPVPVLPGPTSSSVDGGWIELRAQFTDERLWARVHWQDLWVVVQWQDRLGDWHNVEGWQGAFDEFDDGVGKKTWWVDKADFDKGPFRWVIYPSKEGNLLIQTESFYLPRSIDQVVIVEVLFVP